MCNFLLKIVSWSSERRHDHARPMWAQNLGTSPTDGSSVCYCSHIYDDECCRLKIYDALHSSLFIE